LSRSGGLPQTFGPNPIVGTICESENNESNLTVTEKSEESKVNETIVG
jgi:hypothetical protein